MSIKIFFFTVKMKSRNFKSVNMADNALGVFTNSFSACLFDLNTFGAKTIERFSEVMLLIWENLEYKRIKSINFFKRVRCVFGRENTRLWK